jgi:vitamin B12 transporter
MIAPFRCRPLMAGALVPLFSVLSATAQTTSNEIVVTPYRTPTSIAAAGNAITVIRREDIEKWGNAPLADILQGVPGLAVTLRGGPGGNSGLALRGGSSGQTLVLIDGIRAGDPTQTAGEFDFGNLLTTDIERIEVLRGPQSALYGSDAMGGVINIITRKGAGRPKGEASIEGGSYGTASARASVSGGTDTVSYAFSISGLRTDGFSSYGYRIPRLASTLSGPLERDPAEKVGGTARLGFKPADGIEVELGFASFLNQVRFDNGGSSDMTLRDFAFNRQRALVTQGWGKASYETPDGGNKLTLTTFVTETDRRLGYLYWDDATLVGDDYKGGRIGVEVQNDRKIGNIGTLTVGIRHETESAVASTRELPRATGTLYSSIDKRQATNSAFALHRLPIGALTLSLGGRVDAVDDGHRFYTWRSTASYDLEATGTRLRAGIGTGAKAPSLYQRFSSYGTPDLKAEESIGGEIGIDQRLFDGRASLSGTVFKNRYSELIDFPSPASTSAYCPPTQPYGCYINVKRAETQGFEGAADLGILPGLLRARGTYTFLLAEDLEKKTALLQRPQHQGSFSLIYSGLKNLTLEGRVVFVGHRMDYGESGPTRLAPYARFDAFANYRVDDTFSVFARAENLTDAKYQSVYNYGTPGRSAYAGIRAKW